MNIKQAKQIPLEDFLERLGYQPSRKSGAQLWYQSPLRAEDTPSFKINRQRNLWYDFGTGEGGDIIDLVRELEHTNSTSETLARVATIIGSAPLPARAHIVGKELQETSQSLELIHAGPIESRLLFAYLRNRGIDPKKVAAVVQEVIYRCGDREHRALGFANDLGGYELRSPTFKGTLGAKAIRTISDEPDQIYVFEGFFDYLTAIMLQDHSLSGTSIVLNSVNMREKAVDVIRSLKPRTVEVFRDNDTAGEQLLDYFRTSLNDIAINDQAGKYASFSDLNQWHCDQLATSKSAAQCSILMA